MQLCEELTADSLVYAFMDVPLVEFINYAKPPGLTTGCFILNCTVVEFMNYAKPPGFLNWLFYTELHCHRVYKLCKTSGSRFHNGLFYSELHTVSIWINRICVLSLSIRPQLGGDSGESIRQYQLQAWAPPDLWAGHHPWTSLDDSPPGVVQLYTMQQERGGSATVVSTVPGMHKLTVPGMDNGCHRNVIWHIVCVFVLTASCVDVSLAPGNRPVWMCWLSQILLN